MRSRKSWLILLLIIPMSMCVCSLVPMILRYIHEDWSDLSYKSPIQIISLLQSEINLNDASFESVQSVMIHHGVTNCNLLPNTSCVRCMTPVGENSLSQKDWSLAHSLYWWWWLNTFDWVHQINIDISKTSRFSSNRIGVESYHKDNNWWFLSGGMGGTCGSTWEGIDDYFPRDTEWGTSTSLCVAHRPLMFMYSMACTSELVTKIPKY